MPNPIKPKERDKWNTRTLSINAVESLNPDIVGLLHRSIIQTIALTTPKPKDLTSGEYVAIGRFSYDKKDVEIESTNINFKIRYVVKSQEGFTTYIRIFNVTDNEIVTNSEKETDSTIPIVLSSENLNMKEGIKIYEVQVKVEGIGIAQEIEIDQAQLLTNTTRVEL